MAAHKDRRTYGKAMTREEYYAEVERRGRPLTWPGIQPRNDARLSALTAADDNALAESLDAITDELFDTELNLEDFAA